MEILTNVFYLSSLMLILLSVWDLFWKIDSGRFKISLIKTNGLYKENLCVLMFVSSLHYLGFFVCTEVLKMFYKDPEYGSRVLIIKKKSSTVILAMTILLICSVAMELSNNNFDKIFTVVIIFLISQGAYILGLFAKFYLNYQNAYYPGLIFSISCPIFLFFPKIKSLELLVNF